MSEKKQDEVEAKEVEDTKKEETTTDTESTPEPQEVEVEEPSQEQEPPKEDRKSRLAKFGQTQPKEVKYSLEDTGETTGGTPQPSKVDKPSLPANVEHPSSGTPQKDKTSKEPSKKSATASAKVFTRFVEMASNRGASLISGRNHLEYASTPHDLKELQEATVEYFVETGIQLNPLWVFLGTLTMVIGSKFVDAVKHRRADKAESTKKAIDAKEKKETRLKGVEGLKKELIEKAKSGEYGDLVEMYNDRSKFAVHFSGDAKGYYVYSAKGGKKRFAVSKNEHKKEEDSKPSTFVLECYRRLEEMGITAKKQAVLVGQIMRDVQKHGDQIYKERKKELVDG